MATTVSTSFPDSTYSTSNKPVTTTVKADITAIETAINTHNAATTGEHGVTGTIVGTSDTQTLTNKTLTSPVINTGISGTAIVDEDNMVSDSATKVPTQQSVKAYVDTGTVTMTNKTLTSPVLNTAISGTAIASGAEVTTGTDDTQIVTPKALGDAGVNTRLKSKVITATRDLTAASGNVSYTGVGFTPTAIVCFANIDNTGTSAFFSFGAVDSAKTEGGLQYEHETAVRSTATLVYIQPAATNNQTAVVDSFDADGFTLTWTKANSPTGTAQLVFICFR